MTITIEEIDVPAGHGLMSMMKAEYGDLRVMWDHTIQAEVDAARKQFDEMRAEGFSAYRAEGKRGDRGEVLRAFDPKAERIIFFKPNVGG
jgi:hypothetical protein